MRNKTVKITKHKRLERRKFSRWEWIDLAKLYSQDTTLNKSELSSFKFQYKTKR